MHDSRDSFKSRDMYLAYHPRKIYPKVPGVICNLILLDLTYCTFTREFIIKPNLVFLGGRLVLNMYSTDVHII